MLISPVIDTGGRFAPLCHAAIGLSLCRRGSSAQQVAAQRIDSRTTAASYVRAENLLADGALVALFVDAQCRLLAHDIVQLSADGALGSYEFVRKGADIGAAGYILVTPDQNLSSDLRSSIRRLTYFSRELDCHLLDCLILRGSEIESLNFDTPTVSDAIRRLWPNSRLTERLRP